MTIRTVYVPEPPPMPVCDECGGDVYETTLAYGEPYQVAPQEWKRVITGVCESCRKEVLVRWEP